MVKINSYIAVRFQHKKLNIIYKSFNTIIDPEMKREKKNAKRR